MLDRAAWFHLLLAAQIVGVCRHLIHPHRALRSTEDCQPNDHGSSQRRLLVPLRFVPAILTPMHLTAGYRHCPRGVLQLKMGSSKSQTRPNDHGLSQAIYLWIAALLRRAVYLPLHLTVMYAPSPSRKARDTRRRVCVHSTGICLRK